jgi:predicted nuclease of predicted toxin-antitoxin system
VKLLFDANLSPALCRQLGDVFSGSIHVAEVGLSFASDDDVWEFAKQRGLMIVSKDSDFHQRSLVYGAPPKVVWIRTGNCTTNELQQILRAAAAELDEFFRDPDTTFLELGR